VATVSDMIDLMGTSGPEVAALWDQRVAVARACRVLAHRGLVEDVLGHVSLRASPRHALLRCRGPRESGLRFTRPEDIRLVDLDGALVGDHDGWSTPTEAPIHLATLRRHEHVLSVVHAHPPAVVVAGLADIDLVPMFGSYDIPAARLAADGIPVYPRSVLIRDATIAGELLSAMGDRPVVLLRGHGLVTTGASVGEAMVRAIAVDRLCRIALAIVGLGNVPTAIPADDLAALPDLGAGLNTESAWRFHLAALAADGWDLAPGEMAEGHA
jgi:ribulose-5-phosphate 4-epimerase/fuculose-1-phosphate aldolase